MTLTNTKKQPIKGCFFVYAQIVSIIKRPFARSLFLSMIFYSWNFLNIITAFCPPKPKETFIA